jgi:hypothetical protein
MLAPTLPVPKMTNRILKDSSLIAPRKENLAQGDARIYLSARDQIIWAEFDNA